MEWTLYGKTIDDLYSEGLLRKGMFLEMKDGTRFSVEQVERTRHPVLWGEPVYDIGQAYLFEGACIVRYAFADTQSL